MADDYGRDPRSGSGQYLALKTKDEVVIIRIASAPYREPKVWKEGERKPAANDAVAGYTEAQWAAIMANPDFNVTEVFSWKVIDRADSKPKIFSSTPGVYKKIKAFAQQEQWGDPKTYDIQIKRTEDPGPGYYDVMALPNKTEITEKEQEAVDSLEMTKLSPNARLSSNPQIDDLSDEYTKPKAPDAPEEGTDGPAPEAEEEIVIEDIGDEPINLDDIPF